MCFEIVNQVLICEIPGLFFQCWGSHGCPSLLQNEGVANHKIVELENGTCKVRDVLYPNCDDVWVSERVAFVGSSMCSVFGSMLAVLVGE